MKDARENTFKRVTTPEQNLARKMISLMIDVEYINAINLLVLVA